MYSKTPFFDKRLQQITLYDVLLSSFNAFYMVTLDKHLGFVIENVVSKTREKLSQEVAGQLYIIEA